MGREAKKKPDHFWSGFVLLGLLQGIKKRGPCCF
jgi:hypothetical protein